MRTSMRIRKGAGKGQEKDQEKGHHVVRPVLQKKKKRRKKKQSNYYNMLDSFFIVILFAIIGAVFFVISFGFVYIVEKVSTSTSTSTSSSDPLSTSSTNTIRLGFIDSFLRKKDSFTFNPTVIEYYDLYRRMYDDYHHISYNNDVNMRIVTEKNDQEHQQEQQLLLRGGNGDGKEEKSTGDGTHFLANADIDFDNGNIDLSTYGENIMHSKCDVTVLFMDPRLSSNKPGSPAYYSLESVAMFLPNACVLLQTSICNPHDTTSTPTEDRSEQEIYKSIYNSSFPLFRTMIRNGQVRVSFLDHTKYKLKSCDNYYNPSKAFMNIHYWGEDEFINDVDSDLVLVMQDDSVLCHALNIDRYRKYAFVGGTWPMMSDTYHMDFCVSMPIYWKTWTMPQRRWERFRSEAKVESSHHEKNNSDNNRNRKNYAKPDILLDLDFPDICSGENGIGPIGNGGFSLRSRKYMIKAIQSCPHQKYSGINLDDKVVSCQVFDPLNEDLYFGTVLRGIKAPLPSAFEASLFSLEMLWPEQSIDIYGGPKDYSKQRNMHQDFLGTDSHSSSSSLSLPIYQGVLHKEKYYTVPAGIHKAWKYHEYDLLLSADVLNQCPLLEFIVPPNQYLDAENDVPNEESLE